MADADKHILLIIGANVGDAICATPAIHLLRAHQPNATIGLIAASAIAAAVFDDNAALNHIYIAPTPEQLKSIQHHYQCAIDLHNNPSSRPYAQQLIIPLISSPGADPLHLREHPLRAVYQAFPDCQLLAPERYELFIKPEHHTGIKKLLQEQGAKLDKTEILIGCHMGCAKVAQRSLKFWKRNIASHRTWPFANYRKLYDILRARDPAIRFVLTGTLGEQTLAKKYFKGAPGVIDLTGKTLLHELAALMSYCRLFLTGDTAPMHVASATEVPLVALFGSTIPEVTGPYPLRDYITCIQGSNTIKDITVDQVEQAVWRQLEK